MYTKHLPQFFLYLARAHVITLMMYLKFLNPVVFLLTQVETLQKSLCFSLLPIFLLVMGGLLQLADVLKPRLLDKIPVTILVGIGVR